MHSEGRRPRTLRLRDTATRRARRLLGENCCTTSEGCHKLKEIILPPNTFDLELDDRAHTRAMVYLVKGAQPRRPLLRAIDRLESERHFFAARVATLLDSLSQAYVSRVPSGFHQRWMAQSCLRHSGFASPTQSEGTPSESSPSHNASRVGGASCKDKCRLVYLIRL